MTYVALAAPLLMLCLVLVLQRIERSVLGDESQSLRSRVAPVLSVAESEVSCGPPHALVEIRHPRPPKASSYV